jgi:hypothetical protein
MRTRFVWLALIVAGSLLGLSGCELSLPGVMTGRWLFDTTETDEESNPGGELGDGTFTLGFVSETEEGAAGTVESYSGSGTLGGAEYDWGVKYYVDLEEMYSSLHQSGDTAGDFIPLVVIPYSGGNYLSGGYSGSGAYDDGAAKDIDKGDWQAVHE